MPKYLLKNQRSADISNWCEERLREKVDVITIGFNKIIVVFRNDEDKTLFTLEFGKWCEKLDCK